MKYLLAFLLSTLIVSEVHASRIGLGAGVSYSGDYILVPFDISEHLLVEPYFGYDRDDSDTYVVQGLDLGVGVLGRIEVWHELKSYYGVRLEYVYYKSESKIGSSETIRKKYFILPTLGLEYPLGEHFSVGAEISWYLAYTDRGGNDGTQTGTQSMFVARYYF
jgi:hypothetical protein